ncbi:MAG: sensor histidine kinase [Bacteroidales bacterium]
MRHDKKRFLYMVLLGILVTLALNLFIPGKTWEILHVYDFLVSICITIVVWEGNLRIDHWLNQKYPWITMPGRRILVHLLLSVGYSAVVIFIGSFVSNCFTDNMPMSGHDFVKVTAIILAALVLMSVILLSFEISTQFFRHWKNSLVEIEKYRAESLQAQLQNLKNQINPHFLFNNMSVLSSLVYKDQDKAVEFISQLSKVYRYLLDNQNNELVPVEEELTFIRSYIFLLQIRFDKNLVISVDVQKDDLSKLIPPMALQVLIENAIKHNEASSDHPLTISVASSDGKLIITNNLQPRTQHEPGSGTGLQNIRARYQFFTSNPVEIVSSATNFMVKIPLLSSK